jgi:hypothetical protein
VTHFFVTADRDCFSLLYILTLLSGPSTAGFLQIGHILPEKLVAVLQLAELIWVEALVGLTKLEILAAHFLILMEF